MSVTSAVLDWLRANWPGAVAEAVAVATGLAYILLVLRRNRWGWVAGAISSTIYVLIAARAHLPMQSVLNGYYVVMSVYGWFSWTRNAQEQGGRIFRWPLRRHLLAVTLIVAVSALSARLLAGLAQDDWPLLDSITTWTSFLATWMVARSVLENWCYWIAADLIMVFVYLRQGHAPTAGLFASYTVMAGLGLRAWLRRYRQQQP
ncbi:MAG: nicotinamide riboside transporter PnuC [Gammaproteobacteria bacterium]|nr:nicotinamide riboside transporter PnuC [Gammaproteobacteria bacterium]MDE2251496.1 nicotinamide riboside transporter PnuC [Gammaproteobacteria bacterium]